MSRVFISIKYLVCSCFHILQDGFLRWTRPLNTSLLLGALADLARGKSELVAENALLRQQLIILRRQSKRPVCSKRDRILLVLLAKAVRAWRQALLIVQPETLLRWHRQGFRLFWKQKSKPKSAQAKVSAETCFPPIRRWSSTSPCVASRCSLLSCFPPFGTSVPLDNSPPLPVWDEPEHTLWIREERQIRWWVDTIG